MERDLRALPDLEPRNVCGVAAAAIAAVGTVAAGGIMAYGANSAASKQVDAAQSAQATQLHMYNTTRGDLLPYNQGGQADFGAANQLLTGSPAEQQARMEALPGYQFTLTQGLKSTQNAAAARGLGVSGAALKGAASYATGLADSTYGNQVNRLMAGASLGENAAAQTGNAGSQAANGISAAQIGAGNAAAGGIVGATNAASGAFSNLGNLGAMYGMYGGFGGAATNTSGMNVANLGAGNAAGLF